MKKKFYLIDGHAQIFRAYYAPFQLLTSPSGEPVKATHTFTQMLLAILRDREPDYVAIALDVSDKTTERAQLYPEYKANRDETPEDFHPQVERILEIVKAMGIPTYQKSGFEADDVIATIADQLADQDVEIFIVSRDKDLHQLLSPNVRLWDPGKDEILDTNAVRAKFGYEPQEAVEVQVLAGDSVDNIPGVRGVGPKTAVKLIKKYGSAERVIEHADELTPKQRENVLAFREQAPVTRELVTLRRDVSVDFDLEACRRKPIVVDALRPIFEELGFRRLLTQLEPATETTTPAARPSIDPATLEILEASAPQEKPRSRGDHVLVETEEQFQRFIEALKCQKLFAVDTETTSLQAVDCDLVGLSFSWEAGRGYYVPLRSRKGQTLPLEKTLAALKPLLESPEIGKYGQNIKYDIQSLRTEGIELAGVAFDSMLGSYLLFPERRGHGMDALARDLLNHTTVPISELIGKGKNQRSLLDADPQQLADYAAEDAEVTWRLCEEVRPRIESSSMNSLYYDVELPLVHVLADMEYRGIRLDTHLLESISGAMQTRLDALRLEIYKAAGREFKIDSPKQLAEVLFDEQGLRVVRKTKTSRSTDAEVLTTLRNETAHPLPGLVLEYRELSKLRGTYVDPLPQLISPRTGRLHPSYHQTVAATGRLSSSDPNIQNIPIRTDQGKEIRKAFVAPDADHVLIAADYSQIELRILAHLSGDGALIRAFEDDQDIHAFIAAQVAGIEPHEVTSEQRGRAKAINFGIIYGQGAFGLARTLGIPQKDAAEFIQAYKERYQGIVQFMGACVAEAEKTGRVSTLLGRQRVIPEIHSKNRNLRAQGERLAINTVVQGTAADMIKVAMVRTHRRLAKEAPDTHLLVQVHDELVLEAPKATAAERAELVRQEMIAALPLRVPIKVDVAWGDNWLAAKG